MQLFRKKKRSSSRVGVYLHPEQLAVVQLEQRQGQPHLLQCKTFPVKSNKEAPEVLERAIKNMELEGNQCSFVLGPRDYSLQLVEAPKVEPEELRAAVRWKVKDLLDMKIDEAAIDVFPVPEDAYRGREMVYVVAANKSRVQAVVDMTSKAGLEPAVIDIPELAMKNISTACLDDRHGLAFMDLRPSGSTMNVTRGGVLYLTRRINTQLDHDVMQSQEWDGVRDRLVLEIQRSLDYFESQMGQRQVTRVVLAPRQLDTEAMARSLDELLAAKVSALDFSACLQGELEADAQQQQVALLAIGATLRGIQAQQREELEAGQSGKEAA